MRQAIVTPKPPIMNRKTTMNSTLVRIGISAAAAAIAAGAFAEGTNELEEAESSPLSAEVTVDFFSSYMWRGQIYATCSC